MVISLRQQVNVNAQFLLVTATDILVNMEKVKNQAYKPCTLLLKTILIELFFPFPEQMWTESMTCSPSLQRF